MRGNRIDKIAYKYFQTSNIGLIYAKFLIWIVRK